MSFSGSSKLSIVVVVADLDELTVGFTIDVHVNLILKLYGYICVCKQTIIIVSFLCLNPLFSIVQF